MKLFDENSISCSFPVITAAEATYDYVTGRYKKVSVYANPSVKILFDELLTDEQPEAVVIGHLGKNCTYEILKR